jgi:hypothetical protein
MIVLFLGFLFSPSFRAAIPVYVMNRKKKVFRYGRSVNPRALFRQGIGVEGGCDGGVQI